ncbi:restriction system-associated AAA family ATPase [Psychromonas algicola]|uniref:restriction system-associated AAA family ATPase n=1 Tax=Psychromonas algicola TaxID=2555642 RepID=UPI001067259F|nr:restriction system-associated AAA family ATPase [Psychromonas sp. RZ5]TEW52648.1 restriction system-associated AAA family ATPase [Psychromonas sp. RZ5]
MKLIRLHIVDAETCGGLLNGVEVQFRDGNVEMDSFSPLCLIGPNGTGKSQVLQIIAEIFQAVFAKYLPDEEQGTPNNQIQFELEYSIADSSKKGRTVRISRKKVGKKSPDILVDNFIDNEWKSISNKSEIKLLLPSKVIGYTSGDNETLSIPFFVSRAGYANQVRTNATKEDLKSRLILDSRMLLIDYSTNLEVLVANLLLNPENVRQSLLEKSNLKKLRSFRCVIQRKHTAAPSDGVKLTDELECYIDYLKSCATCFNYDEQTWTWTFDFYVQNATNSACEHYWKGGALELYSCFHKLAMLNDLIIPAKDRAAYEKGVELRRFASRLPEPMERQKVFRFERVEFISKKSNKPVDYVSLSDGEHQFAQLLGTLCMASFPNVLFLLDEPESHFNPKWRVDFISNLMDLPTISDKKCKNEGKRSGASAASIQDCLITTHSPFVPSDMDRKNVLIFSKNETGEIKSRPPRIQTFGSKFDAILAECFDISPQISGLPRDQIKELMTTGTKEQIQEAIANLGESNERMRLAGKLALILSEEN